MAGLYEEANKELADGARRAGEALGARNLIPNTSAAITGSPGKVADAYETGGAGAAFGMGVRQVASIPVGLAQDAYRAGSAAHGAVMGKVINPVAGGISDAVRTAVTGEVRPSQADTTSGRLPFSVLPNSSANMMGGPNSDSPLGGGSPLNNFANPPAPRTPGVPMISSPSQPTTEGRGNVMSIDMNAANRSLAAANQVHQQYLDSFGGPKAGSISNPADETNARFAQSRMMDALGNMSGRKAGALAQLAGINAAGERAVADLASRDMNAAEDRAMRSGAEMARLGIDRARLGLDQQKEAVTSAARGIDMQLALQQLAGERRKQGLIDSAMNETDPAKRAAAERNLRTLSGQQDQNRYTVVPGGQEVTEQGMRTVPSRVLNNQTGQFVEQPAAAPIQAPAGAVAALRADPKRAAEFDQKYGQGASARYLAG